MYILFNSGDPEIPQPPGGGSGTDRFTTAREDAPIGSVIAAIVARTPGTGDVIRNYQKAPGSDPRNYFTVEQQTGQEIQIHPKLRV